MILADAQWRDILKQLTDKDKFGFTLVEENTDLAVLTKDCEIGGRLMLTYVYADGNETPDDVFMFSKGLPSNTFSQIVPSSIQQLYGAIKVMIDLA